MDVGHPPFSVCLDHTHARSIRSIDKRMRATQKWLLLFMRPTGKSPTAGILPIGDELRERIIFRGIAEIFGKRPP